MSSKTNCSIAKLKCGSKLLLSINIIFYRPLFRFTKRDILSEAVPDNDFVTLGIFFYIPGYHFIVHIFVIFYIGKMVNNDFFHFQVIVKNLSAQFIIVENRCYKNIINIYTGKALKGILGEVSIRSNEQLGTCYFKQKT